MPNIGELIGDGASKLLREGVEGVEKATEKSIAKGEAKFVRDNLSTDWKEITGPEIKRFKGKSATLSNGNNPDLENRILNKRAKFDEAEQAAANFRHNNEQNTINDNVRNWRQKEQEYYNSRANDVSNNYHAAYEKGEDMNEILDTEKAYKDKYRARHDKKKVKQEQKAKRIDPGDVAAAEDIGKAWGGGNKKMPDSSAGAAAAEKENFGKMDTFLKKAVPIAVGGGLVFSMFNRGGQMSNSELYGQQQQYGSGGGGY